MHLLLGEKAATTLGFDNPRLSALLPVLRHAAVNVLRRAAAYAVPGGRRRFEDRQRAAAREVLVAAGLRVQADLTYHRAGGADS
jgi:8-oxo-dGTP pyrophosphatase MutT (NUDIX family)